MKVARDSFLTSGLRSGRWRRGSSLLEVQIAFAMLGIGLAGLCPFVVMQLRQLANSNRGSWPVHLQLYPHSVGMATRHRASRNPDLTITWFPGTTLGRETDDTGPVADGLQQSERPRRSRPRRAHVIAHAHPTAGGLPHA